MMLAMKLLSSRRHLQLLSYSSASPLSSLAEHLSDNPIKFQNDEASSLTHQQLTKINLLLPRLCLSNNHNHLHTATNLIVTALLANPPPNSISISFLIHSLTSLHDLTLCMSLLNRLNHSPPAHTYLTPITTMLISSFLRKGRLKEAFKVYNWMLRSDSPCKAEPLVFGILVNGFCKKGFVCEGLEVLRDMAEFGFAPNTKLRERVFRSLLMEARVREAKTLDEVLCNCVEDAEGEGFMKLILVLDDIIRNWTD